MSYEIIQVDISNNSVENELRFLIKDAFQRQEPIPEGHLYRNTVSKSSSMPTIFLAAIENGKIIGCNGFLSSDFNCNGRIVTGYQSCWSATHPNHQGRKIFVNIINEGKKILSENGAGFIYGLPNDNSRPIFIKKLGFIEIPCKVLKIPNIPILRSFWSNGKHGSAGFAELNDMIHPLEKQIAELKKGQDTSVVELEVNQSYLWGKLKAKTKYGLKLNYFYLGGLTISDPRDMRLLMEKVYSLPVGYIQIVSCASNSYNLFFTNWKEAQGVNPFIFFELNSKIPEHVNMMYGLIDVF
jgi:hypothetical protein